MHTIRLILSAGVFVVLTALLVSACGDPAVVSAVLPEFQPTSTIKDIMLSIVDPSADAVWLSVTTVVSSQGIVDSSPQTEDDWAAVRRGAVTLMESANLLQIPGRKVARPGEVSEAPGVELEPAEMDALIADDLAGWNGRARALHDAAEAVLQAVDNRQVERIFELGENIEVACENCHVNYWYPNEKIPEIPAAP